MASTDLWTYLKKDIRGINEKYGVFFRNYALGTNSFTKKSKCRSDTKKKGGQKKTFTLMLHYEQKLSYAYLPLLRIAFAMPLLNYGLFAERILLQFPLSPSDLSLLNDLNKIFCRDIFVNKILRRRADYILPEYLPNEQTVSIQNAQPKAPIESTNVTKDRILFHGMHTKSCGVLSSGGKESLLTYGLLTELKADVHPVYVNESGGHWKTALTAYRYHTKINPLTCRVWTNVDRFYVFMLDNLSFIRPDHRNVRADTYPIRLCIFPFYIFILLPIFANRHIGNLLLGSELDDIRIQPLYKGIPHYCGMYDQHQDFDLRMNDWYNIRMPGLRQWSALRTISGLVVERVLTERYPQLARVQRSCHSCHSKKSKIVPCGTCSKCYGVLLFLMANKADPRLMGYTSSHIQSFLDNVKTTALRLDDDEKNHSLNLLFKSDATKTNTPSTNHVECLHINTLTSDQTLIPQRFRQPLLRILKRYTTGTYTLKDGVWIRVKK